MKAGGTVVHGSRGAPQGHGTLRSRPRLRKKKTRAYLPGSDLKSITHTLGGPVSVDAWLEAGRTTSGQGIPEPTVARMPQAKRARPPGGADKAGGRRRGALVLFFFVVLLPAPSLCFSSCCCRSSRDLLKTPDSLPMHLGIFENILLLLLLRMRHRAKSSDRERNERTNAHRLAWTRDRAPGDARTLLGSRCQLAHQKRQQVARIRYGLFTPARYSLSVGREGRARHCAC